MLLLAFDYLSGNVPGGIWILILFIFIAWFIVWYVYSFSGILSKKRFYFLGLGISFLLMIIYSVFWSLYPPPGDRTRILITFSENPSTSKSFSQIYTTGYHLYDFLTLNLASEDFLVYHPDWILKMDSWDTFAEVSFQEKLVEFMDADYIFSIKTSEDSSAIHGVFINVSSNSDTLLTVHSGFTGSGDFTGLTQNILMKLGCESKDQKIITPNYQNWSPERWNEWGTGRLFFLNDDLNTARKYYKKCLTSEPGFAPAILGLAMVELDSARLKKASGGFFQNQLALANSNLFKIKNENALDAESFRVWGEYAILFENFVLAEEKLKRSYELNPNNDKLYIDFSRLHRSRYSDLGFIDEESLYKYGLFINPASIPVRIWYADYLHRNNRKQEAFELFQTFLEKFPQQFELQAALGKLYITGQKYTEAIALFSRMKKQHLDRQSSLNFNLGISYYLSGDTLSAKVLFEEIAASGSNPDVYLYLAEIAEENGDLDLAVDYLRKRIRENRGFNDPFKEEARRHLVVLLKIIGNLAPH